MKESIILKYDKHFNVITHAFNGEGGKLHVPIKLWQSQIEDGALMQLDNVANLPFAFHHVSAMADSHVGYGMPIGGVFASKGYVIPNAVGKDVGCGVCSIRTNLFTIGKDILKKIMGNIRKLIPVGFKHNKRPQKGMPEWKGFDFSKTIIDKQWHSATKQLGTLGGGNHFIEIQMGDDGWIYIMIHSGSRNLGSRIADHYDKIAVDLNKKWLSKVDKKQELAFLPFNENEGQMYFQEMNFACDFALANRKLMMDKVQEAFHNHIDVNFSDFINIHHNYAAMEHHFGENVLVHRKGATRARQGEMGLIPGSQGTASYIVEGRGNADSFESCSHGAGRVLSRKKAKKELDINEEIKKMDDQGIIHGMRNKSDLEEASSAYKDIDDVMYHQQDLVLPRVKLKPLAVIKG